MATALEALSDVFADFVGLSGFVLAWSSALSVATAASIFAAVSVAAGTGVAIEARARVEVGVAAEAPEECAVTVLYVAACPVVADKDAVSATRIPENASDSVTTVGRAVAAVGEGAIAKSSGVSAEIAAAGECVCNCG